ncbi:MAG: YicC/YloC family endoribonuclease [Planctomycetota bacterium]|nr:YicC/YloC family endoribonuclease [Planctomycetota bacterium]MEC8559945.1 YicC/YloC family endoribonuclease [Planctomycetota bacterium]MEC9157980.1 YicC/YloC family endoribonuclease [Planctomycetota bacterium]MEC9233218.1 YicC/YloC family endoribonuclease [Planctomycetota bacterium]
MTGFGSSSIEIEGMQYSVEIRSVNNKYFKAQVRLPDELLALETELESELARRIARGSVSVTIRRDGALSPESLSVDARMVEGVLSSLEAAVPESLADRCTIDLANLLQVPGVLVQEPVTALVDRVRPVLLKLLGQAVDAMIQMREREGLVLREDLLGFREGILARLSVVADRAPAVVEQYQQRLRQRMEQLIEQVGGSVAQEDLLKEVAVYAERTDISEEVVRLTGHLDQFRDLVASDGGEPVGRTLDFLAQEMLREANTIASKSADSEISRSIVEIKGLIDRIKEQSANAE